MEGEGEKELFETRFLNKVYKQRQIENKGMQQSKNE